MLRRITFLPFGKVFLFFINKMPTVVWKIVEIWHENWILCVLDVSTWYSLNSLCFYIFCEFFVLLENCLEGITNSLLSCYVEFDELWWKESDKGRIKLNRSLKGIYAMLCNWQHQSAIKWWLNLMRVRDRESILVLLMTILFPHTENYIF